MNVRKDESLDASGDFGSSALCKRPLVVIAVFIGAFVWNAASLSDRNAANAAPPKRRPVASSPRSTSSARPKTPPTSPSVDRKPAPTPQAANSVPAIKSGSASTSSASEPTEPTSNAQNAVDVESVPDARNAGAAPNANDESKQNADAETTTENAANEVAKEENGDSEQSENNESNGADEDESSDESEKNGESSGAGLLEKIEDAANSKTELLPFSSEPFDPTTTKIASGFRGHDVGEVFDAICSLFGDSDSDRDEFETKNEYKTRAASFQKEIADKTLLGTVKFSSPLAFKLSGEVAKSSDGDEAYIWPEVKDRYVADRKKFVVYCDDFFMLVKGTPVALCLKTDVLDLGSYIGENSFGVERNVEKSKMRCYGVTFDCSKIGSKGYFNGSDIYWTLKDVPTDQARDLKGNVGVLCVCSLKTCKLTPDRIVAYFFDVHTKEPTLDSPTEWTSFDYALYVTPPEFWLYDERSGDVLAKFSALETFARKPKKLGLADAKTNAQLDASAISVPGDVKTLAEALKQLGEGGCVLLDDGEYDVSDLTLDTMGASILGNANDASNVVFTAKSGAPLRVVNDAKFEGITFRAPEKVPSGSKRVPCVELEGGESRFSNCKFDGSENAVKISDVGVEASGESTGVSFEKCEFVATSSTGVLISNGAKGTATDCKFGPDNAFGASANNGGALTLVDCEFVENSTGAYFGKNATGAIRDCRFKKNDEDWKIVESAKSVETTGVESDAQ